jgi:hypothetical protein
MKSLIFLFLVALMIFALVGQNLSPSLPLVLLGIKSIALPVGVWVALAIFAGGITAGMISLFFPRSRSLSDKNSKSQQRRSVTPPPPQDPKFGGEPSSRRGASQTVYTSPSNAFDDTEDIKVEYASVTPSPMGDNTGNSQPRGEEVWDDGEEWESTAATNAGVERSSSEDEENRRVVEIRKEPIVSNLQGSIYSYTYRSPEDVRISSPQFSDDEEDEETLDLRNLAPEPPIDPFPQMEIIDPILEPDSSIGKREGATTSQKDRSSPKPQSQNLPEDDWSQDRHPEDEDW